MDNKEIRERVGYTYQAQLESADLWHQNSLSFHEASIVLHEHQELINGGIRIFLFNAAQSIELIFKAILAAKGEVIPNIHNLRELCVKAGVELKEDQKHTLDLMTEIIMWLARYPSPRSELQWDKFQDIIMARHIVHSQQGNTYSTSVNPKRFPSMENYMRIWGICLERYCSILTK
jgi:HEPN domain-containing protein